MPKTFRRRPYLSCPGPRLARLAGILLSVLLASSGPDEGAAVDLQGAVDLSAADGQIIIPTDDNLRELDNFSLDMRVRLHDSGSGNFLTLNSAWDQDGFYFQFFRDHLVLGFGRDGETTQVATAPDIINIGQWVRLSAVKDGGRARIYLDGEEVAEGQVAEATADAAADAVLGPKGYAPLFDIARFRFWDEPLDGNRIAMLDSAAGSGGVPRPLIDYDFDDIDGAIVGNAAGRGYDGIIDGEVVNLALGASDGSQAPAPAAPVEAVTEGGSSPDQAVGYALDLAGPGRGLVVEALDLPPPGGNFTMQLALMLDEARPGRIAEATSASGAFFAIDYDADQLLFRLGDGDDDGHVAAPRGVLDAHTWADVTVMQNDGMASLLLNDVRVASYRLPSGLGDRPMRLAIGDGTGALRLGALRVWNRALTVQEIRAGAQATEADLLLSLGPWSTPGRGARVPDRSGSGHDGRLNGPPDELWTRLDPMTTPQLDPETVLQRLSRSADRGEKVLPAQRNEQARRRAALDDAVDIAAGQSRILTLGAPATTVIVDDANIARAEILSPRKVYLFGVQAGRTGLRALDGGDSIVEETVLRVGADVEAGDQELSAIEGGADNRFTDQGGRAVLEGSAVDVGEAVALAELSESSVVGDQPARNATTIESAQQVNIKVRFAEVSRNDLKRLGIDWNAVINASSLDEAIAGQFFLSDGLADAAGSVFGRIEAGDVNLDFLFEALQQEGALSLLAEPNLTVLNGEEARFLAGGELPIPVPQENGTSTIEFKPFGISLTFTPVLLDNERISLRVDSEVSDISAQGAVQLANLLIPAITVRRVQTSLELGSGQTFAVGGLFNRTVTRNIDKIPGLGSIPILGALFRSTRYNRSETELVILITPYLVRPTSDPGRLALPSQRHTRRDARAYKEDAGVGFIVQ